MAGKKIFLEFDIDGQDLKIAGQDTLSLTQQLRILKKELQKGSLSAGEFEILRKKIGDTEDQIAKTTTRSKDLFGVLSSIPGPIGAIGGQVSMVVETLKIFSGFSFKDLKNSLGDVLDDVKDITKGFFGMSDASKKVGETNASVASSTNAMGTSMGATAGAAGGAAASMSQFNAASLNTVVGQVSLQQSVARAGEALGVQLVYLGKNNVGMVTSTGVVRNLTQAEIELIAANKTLAISKTGDIVVTQGQTVATNVLTVAQKAAAFAAKALKIALAATGIGLIVIGIMALVKVLSEFKTRTDDATAANNLLNNTLKEQERLLAGDTKALDNATKAQISRAKIAGATEQEIYNIQKKAGEDKLKLLKENDQRILDTLDKTINSTVLKEEDKQKALDDLRAKSLKSNQDVIDQTQANEQASLDFQVQMADKGRSAAKEANDKRIAENKEDQDKINADKKTAGELALTLETENSVLRLKNERDRQDKQLENARKSEKDNINLLTVSGEIKTALLLQIDEKYNLKKAELTEKRNEEDLKAKEDFQMKIEDIMNAAIADEEERYIAERNTKYKRDLKSLEEDVEFIKLSEERKQAVRNGLKDKFNNEDNDKADADRMTALDDELSFLQIKNEGLEEGSRAYFDNQLEILNLAEEKELASVNLTEEKRTAITEKYTKAREDLKKRETKATIAGITASLDALASLTSALASSYDEEAKTSKAAFEKRKKLQKATALMSAASGIIQIMTQPSSLLSPYDYIVKAALAVALGVTTAVQIGKINATQFEGGGGTEAPAAPVGNQLGKGYATGGIIQGPGTGTSDSIPVRASNGEAVMTANAVSMFAPLLGLMNQAGGGTNFGSNLNNDPSNNTRGNDSGNQSQLFIKTYVVESELSSTQQRQARLKDLSVL